VYILYSFSNKKKLDFLDLQIYLTALTTVRRRRASVIRDQMTEAGFAGRR
jgi:hypothetical protein